MARICDVEGCDQLAFETRVLVYVTPEGDPGSPGEDPRMHAVLDLCRDHRQVVLQHVVAFEEHLNANLPLKNEESWND